MLSIRIFILGLASLALMAQRPLQVEDLFKVKRVADPQVSRQGDRAWQVGTVDLPANTVTTRLWIQPVGQEARALDLGEGSQTRPRFSPDGKWLAYQKQGQIWTVDLGSGERKQITHLSGECQGQIWSPDGHWLAFTSVTVPSGNDAENAAYLKQQEESKAKAHHATTLMYRHWNEWKDPQQVSHLFVARADGRGEAKDLTPGFTFDVPNLADVADGDDYDWSPDSMRLAFGAHPGQTKAVSTNGEIYEVPLDGRTPSILSRNKAMDTQPRYSPDGKFLAWRAQRRPGYESDLWALQILDRANGTQSTHAFTQSIGGFNWVKEGIVFAAESGGHHEIYQWNMQDAEARQITHGLTVEEFTLQGDSALARLSSFTTPPDLFEIDLTTGKTSRVSHHNEALAQELKLNSAEAMWVKSVDGAQVQAWVIKPVGFDPARKYPVAFVLHGGPQGSNGDEWHPRWNGQAFAGRGFLTVMPNPRGSTGFGQAFTDRIRADWNGLVMKDLLAVLDGVFKRYPNADPKRVVAAGASYGGYAVNWLAGHYPDRFAAFVSHAGIWNLESMQLSTEELWFPRWEFKGWPWESTANRERWRAQSPSNGAARLVKPMLVSHGEQDFRVPVGEAYQLYNTLQLKGVPSELLIFPEECHFIQKPQNSKLWYETVLGWCEIWTKDPPRRHGDHRGFHGEKH